MNVLCVCCNREFDVFEKGTQNHAKNALTSLPEATHLFFTHAQTPGQRNRCYIPFLRFYRTRVNTALVCFSAEYIKVMLGTEGRAGNNLLDIYTYYCDIDSPRPSTVDTVNFVSPLTLELRCRVSNYGFVPF